MPKCDCGSEKTYGENTNLHAAWCSSLIRDTDDWLSFKTQNLYSGFYTYYWVTSSADRLKESYTVPAIEARGKIPFFEGCEFWIETSLQETSELVALCKAHGKKYKLVI